MTATPPMNARPPVARVRPASSRSVVVFPAPFGPSSPNTDPAGTVIVSDVEGDDAARVALGQVLDHDRRRVGVGPRTPRRTAASATGGGDGSTGRCDGATGATIGGSCGLPQPGIAPGPGRLRLDRAVLATDEEVEDRPDHADEHDDDGPHALAAAADGAIVAEEVDDREHQEPDLDDRQGDDQQRAPAA